MKDHVTTLQFSCRYFVGKGRRLLPKLIDFIKELGLKRSAKIVLDLSSHKSTLKLLTAPTKNRGKRD